MQTTTPTQPPPPKPATALKQLQDEEKQLVQELQEAVMTKPEGHWHITGAQERLDKCRAKMSPQKQMTCCKAAVGALHDLTDTIQSTEKHIAARK
eukprot:65753-Karenia_brevis.AAC.1